MDTDEYEYGILYAHFDAPHRWGMTEEEARTWVAECEAEGFKPGVFTVIRRRVGKWETVE